MKRFDELEVLETAGSRAGAFAGRLFADYGARVTKLAAAEGRPARAEGAAGTPPRADAAHLDGGKRAHPIDLSNPSGREDFEELLGEADVLIESSAPEPLVPLGERFRVSGLVELRISPFPATGPYARYRSNAFSDEALAGLSILNGEPGREPLARSGRIAPYQAGAQGFLGALAALRARERTGRGQRVEVSHFEALVGAHQHGLAMWSHAGHRLVREGNRQPGFWHPSGIYPCRDGHVYLGLTSQAMRDRFFAAMDLPEILLDPRFHDDLALSYHKADFDAQLCPWLLEHTQADLIALGQAAGAAVGPVTPMLEVIRDPALRERAFWQGVEGAPDLLQPGRPFRIDTSPPATRAAPGPPRGTASHATSECADGPLQGIRILDLTRIWAGPLAARQLADLGADVVLVESPGARGSGRVEPELAAQSHLFPGDDPGKDPWNRLGAFNDLMRNRRGITLDLRRPEARRVFEDLIAQVDVVIENFRPRVMAGLGLDFEALQARNPSLCHVAISGFGDSGGRRDWAAYGPMLEAAAGHSLGMGYRDSGPYRAGVSWADPLSGVLAAAGTLLALQERDSDPDRRGRRVDVSIFETTLCALGEELIEAQRAGANPVRRGNRHPQRAPQGCYPCRGDDAWIAISVTDDDAWWALCGCAELGAEWAGLGFAERVERHDEIDARLADWTRGHTSRQLMEALQAVGVIAASQSDASDLFADPQLAAGPFWCDGAHPATGRRAAPGCAIRLSDTPASHRRPAPRLGEHNREVLRAWAGLADDDLDELEALGILVDAPPGAG